MVCSVLSAFRGRPCAFGEVRRGCFNSGDALFSVVSARRRFALEVSSAFFVAGGACNVASWSFSCRSHSVNMRGAGLDLVFVARHVHRRRVRSVLALLGNASSSTIDFW